MHKAIVVKIPQNVTSDEWSLAAAYAYSFRHTLTASHNDMLTILRGGSEDSYVKLLWPQRQPDVIPMIKDAGYTWETVPGFHAPRIRLSHPFAYRYAMSSGFNAPRTYGLHEGVDFVVLGAGSDKPVNVLATLSGVVDKVGWSPNGYGNYVRVLSKLDGLDIALWYGHLDTVIVGQWQRVAVGDALGEVGNTGNSTGEHLHLTVQLPGHGLDGYVVDDVIDPTSLLPSITDINALPIYNSSANSFDLLPYVCGDGRSYEVINGNGGSEIFQSQREGNTFYQVKAWSDLSIVNYEQFALEGSDYILRDIDTSPGGGRYYRLFNSRWVKRFMSINESFTSSKRVQFYKMNDCSEDNANSGYVTDTIKFIAHYPRLTLKSGVVMNDVIQFRWINGGEDYWYAKNYGLVQWARTHNDNNSPAWSALLRERADIGRLERLKIPCINS